MTRLPNPQFVLDWRERLSRFDQSNLTIAAFCEREGCSTASFYQWRRRLRAGELPNPTQILMTTPGISYYSGLTLASRHRRLVAHNPRMRAARCSATTGSINFHCGWFSFSF